MRRLGNDFNGQQTPPLQEDPTAIDGTGDNQRNQGQGQTGAAGLLHRFGEDQAPRTRCKGFLALVLANDFLAIQAKELSVGAQKANGIRGSRQVIRPAFFQSR